MELQCPRSQKIQYELSIQIVGLDIASTHPVNKILDELLQDVAYLMSLFYKVKSDCMFMYMKNCMCTFTLVTMEQLQALGDIYTYTIYTVLCKSTEPLINQILMY